MAGLPTETKTCRHCGWYQAEPDAPCTEPLDGGRLLGKRCRNVMCKRILAVVGACENGKALPQSDLPLTETEIAYLRFFRWVLAVDRRRWKDRESPERPYPLMLRPKD